MAADGVAVLTTEAAAAAAAGEGQETSLVRAPVKHVLSKELQLYFDRVARILRAKPGQLNFASHHSLHAVVWYDQNPLSICFVCVTWQQC